MRFMLLLVAVLGFISLMTWVHDYPQTKQAIINYEFGDGLLWVVAFYFVNEAGSGIKYELTGDLRHLGYFPRIDTDRTGRDPRRDFEIALYSAEQGDWEEQLRVSHLIALGWGEERNLAESARWYLKSEKTAKEAGEIEQWETSSRRQAVRPFILLELGVGGQQGENQRWRELSRKESTLLLTESGRG